MLLFSFFVSFVYLNKNNYQKILAQTDVELNCSRIPLNNLFNVFIYYFLILSIEDLLIEHHGRRK